MDRRTFVKLMGAASAATTATLLMPGGLGAPGVVKDFFGGNDFKIGVLLPTSETYPRMGDNLLAGMQAFFGAQSQFSPAFVTDEVPYGYSGAAARANKLAQDDRVDLVVAGVGSKVAPQLRNVFDESGVPYVISNIGASPIPPADLGKFGLHNSLGLWQSSWATGNWAGKNVGKKGVIVTTLADGGYASTYSFQLGMESVGGQVVDTYYIDLTSMTDGESVIDQIAAAKPDFVFAMLSGPAGSDFLSDYESWSLPPLLASGFMAESFALPNTASAAGLVSAGSWADALETNENRAFTEAFRQQTGREPDQFAVLGFETAQLIDESARAVGGRMGNGDRVIDALAGTSITSPRGLVAFDPETRSTTAPLYLREVRSERTSWRNVVLSKLPGVSLIEATDAGVMAAAKTGLLNEYLCCQY